MALFQDLFANLQGPPRTRDCTINQFYYSRNKDEMHELVRERFPEATGRGIMTKGTVLAKEVVDALPADVHAQLKADHDQYVKDERERKVEERKAKGPSDDPKDWDR